MPEWKTKALGKAPTFGFSDVRPIKEQRESLPIFKLRDQLIQAVTENQVRGPTAQHASLPAALRPAGQPQPGRACSQAVGADGLGTSTSAHCCLHPNPKCESMDWLDGINGTWCRKSLRPG